MSAWLDITLVSLVGLGAVALLGWRLGLLSLVSGRRRKPPACGTCTKCDAAESLARQMSDLNQA